MPVIFPLTGLSHGLKRRGIPALLYGFMPMGGTPTKLTISGVTKDSTGAVLGGCAVSLFRTSDDAFLERVTSDAVTGAYAFSAVGLGQTYYVVAYKAGSPDVAGTTMNTLVGMGP